MQQLCYSRPSPLASTIIKNRHKIIVTRSNSTLKHNNLSKLSPAGILRKWTQKKKPVTYCHWVQKVFIIGENLF